MIDTQGNNEIDLDKMDNKNGILINGQHPVFGSKKVDEIKGRKNKLKLDIYNYPDNIEIISDEESIAILFIGQSGTGKSTFINAYVNHLLGISFNDSIRYKLIFGDKNKVKDQTQSQTDKISVYNIRSPQYKNRLFKLIDTPGAGDTRNQNDQSITDLEKDKMEKEFLIMYNDLFSKQIGQLNSIVFVVKASENRENDFQKRIIKNLTNIFADDIQKNCLAILTHTDNDEIEPDAVQLLEKMDFFAQKTKNEEEWYFPVSSTSYFIPFKVGGHGATERMFPFTENSLKEFTEKILTLKVYYTKETKKNLELKNKQEKIIKILKNDILNFLLDNIKNLKKNEIDLEKAINEVKLKQSEIEDIKNQISSKEELKQQIKENYDQSITNKRQKEEDLARNEENIQSLKNKKNILDQTLNDLEKKKKLLKKKEKLQKNNKIQ
jgi:GTPase SAR1 family protein